jgi:hypothetical protein
MSQSHRTSRRIAVGARWPDAIGPGFDDSGRVAAWAGQQQVGKFTLPFVIQCH